MSKIKNGGLGQYGAGSFEQQQFGTAGVERVNVELDIIGHFGDKSFEAIDCTRTDNQKQGNKTPHTP